MTIRAEQYGQNQLLQHFLPNITFNIVTIFDNCDHL